MTDDDDDSNKKYTIYLPDPPQSSLSPFASLGTQNLISLYGLDRLAQYLARNDAYGQPRKLRKTYKDYLATIPGRHTIERDDMISRILMNDSGNREPHETVDSATLVESVNLAPGSIPGFDESWIGMDEDEDEDNGNEEDARDESPGSGRRRKRKYGSRTPEREIGAAAAAAAAQRRPATATGTIAAPGLRKKRRKYDGEIWDTS